MTGKTRFLCHCFSISLLIDYFIKLAIVDAMKEFKELIPRKKKQALRSKITALGEREGQKTSEPVKKGQKVR